MTTDKGNLFVFSGPSGTGKGTILDYFNKHFNSGNVKYSVSATTRNPRAGEINGVNYFFLSDNEFMELVKNDGLLEWTSFCCNHYGTPKAPVMDALEKSNDVILEIETQGAFNVKAAYPDAILIFVLPPSLNELKTRLKGRGTESDEIINQRFEEAIKEISHVSEYDYVIVNDDIKEAAQKFNSIIIAERLKTVKNKNTILEVYKNDLSIN